MYKLYIDSKNQKKRYDATDIVSNVNISSYMNDTATKLEFTLLKDGIVIFHEGDAVSFYVDDIPVFYGYVFTKDKNEKDEIKTTCYDQLRYLKAKDSYEFIGKGLKDIIETIANYYKLQVGTIQDTAYQTQYYYHEDESMLDIINYHLNQAKIQLGKELIFYDDFGKLTLKYADDLVSNTIIGLKSLATKYSYKTDIDSDTYNLIKLARPNKDTGMADIYQAQDSNTLKRWGTLQYYEVVDENLNPEQIKEYLKLLFNYHNKTFRTLSLNDVIGIPGIRGGSTVFIDIPDIGDISLSKRLLVNKATHKFTSSEHVMSLEMTVR